MSLTLPAGIDWRDEIAAKLDLVRIDTPDGPFRFLIGTDGIFTDTNGNDWHGSQLITAGDQTAAINGLAPAGELQLTYISDPELPDLAGQIRDLGLDYVRDRDITFFVQPFADIAEFYAPRFAPIQVMRRRMKGLTIRAEGELIRTVSLSFESAWEARRAVRRRIYNTADHAKLVGHANPSLEFIPTSNFQEEKLFG